MASKINNAGQGSGVTYTVDPTVNGPWTHTRPDIPLFKPGAAGGANPTAPGAGGNGKGPNGNGLTGRAALGHISNQQKAQMQAGFDQWMKDGLGGGGFRGAFGFSEGGPAAVRGSGMALGGAGRGNGGSAITPPIAPVPEPTPAPPAVSTPVTPGTPPTSIGNPSGDSGFSLDPGQMPSGNRGPASIFQPQGNQPGVYDPRTPISRRNRDALAVALSGGTLNSNPRRGI